MDFYGLNLFVIHLMSEFQINSDYTSVAFSIWLVETKKIVKAGVELK